MNTFRLTVLLFAGTSVLKGLLQAASPDYEKDIRLILETKCYSCHGSLEQRLLI